MRTLDYIKPPMDLNPERGSFISGERRAFIGRREEIPDGEARVSGGREPVYDQGRKRCLQFRKTGWAF